MMEDETLMMMEGGGGEDNGVGDDEGEGDSIELYSNENGIIGGNRSS